jgi:hypothetical protein
MWSEKVVQVMGVIDVTPTNGSAPDVPSGSPPLQYVVIGFRLEQEPRLTPQQELTVERMLHERAKRKALEQEMRDKSVDRGWRWGRNGFAEGSLITAVVLLVFAAAFWPHGQPSVQPIGWERRLSLPRE